MAAAQTVESKHFDMIRRLRVADYLTLSNAICGVFSIFCAVEHRFLAAFALIFAGYQFDRFDGTVARWRNECSDWGKELDSFADLVTFVAAPAVMAYCFGLHRLADQTALAFYVICGLTRLARFNITVHLVPKSGVGRTTYIEGLPTPYAALLLSSVIATLSWNSGHGNDVQLASRISTFFDGSKWGLALIMTLGTAMVSKSWRISFSGRLAFLGTSHTVLPELLVTIVFLTGYLLL